MEEQEQRIAIAAACGISVIRAHHGRYYTLLRKTQHHPEGYEDGSFVFEKNAIDKIPRYTSDLNAMHEAIKYARANLRDIDKEPFWCDGQFSIMANKVLDRNHYDNDVPLMLITAPQYAEIFLRTLNLWK